MPSSHRGSASTRQRGNGYIWHTTGSGKTLTSFKASTLLKDNPDIHKCLFVVDRKDLDRQTREEFNRFQEGCVEENTNTAALVRRLLSDDYADKVIVTTIQKLGLALDENSKRNKQRTKNGQPPTRSSSKPLSDKRIVFIFDECHRSQFGENHKAIKEFFPKAQLFGFTGTPIFEANASPEDRGGPRPVHAAPRRPVPEAAARLHHHPRHRRRQRAALPRRLLQARRQEPAQARRGPGQESRHRSHPGQARHRHRRPPLQRPAGHRLHQRRHRIPRLFKTELQAAKQAADPDFKPLNIACVFSPAGRGRSDVKQIQEDLPQEKAGQRGRPRGKKAALKAILADYNARYGTNHRLGEFDLYYQDVQKRIKDQQWPNADYPPRRRSTSPSWWTCCSPASTAST
jgi:type I restriction enzyme R subunit